jgi:protein disulfide-isomerase A1
VALIKVDATEHTKAAGRFEVQGYPTLKWFKNGEASDYAGGRTAGDIVTWISKKSGPPAVAIANVEEAKAFDEKNDVAVLGVFASADSDEAKAFVAAAEASELPFGISTDAAVASEFGASVPAVVVLKDFDNGNVVYDGDYESAAIQAFASAESLPLLIEFSDENAPKIFGGEVKTHLLLFAKKTADGYKDLADAMTKTAGDFKGQVLFISMDAEKEDNARYASEWRAGRRGACFAFGCYFVALTPHAPLTASSSTLASRSLTSRPFASSTWRLTWPNTSPTLPR